MLAFCEHTRGFLGEPCWGFRSIAPYTWDPAAAPALWPHCSCHRRSPHRLLLLKSSHQAGSPPGWDCSKLAQEQVRFHDVHTVMRNSYNLVIPEDRKCERRSCHRYLTALPSIPPSGRGADEQIHDPSRCRVSVWKEMLLLWQAHLVYCFVLTIFHK